MKRFTTFWMTALMMVSAIAMVGCSEDAPVEEPDDKTEVPAPVLTLTSEAEMTFEAEGGKGEIRYTLENPVEGAYVLPACEAEWVYNLTSGEVVEFSVSPNEGDEERTTTIVVSYKEQQFEVAVKQLAAEPEEPENPDDPENPEDPEDPEDPEQPEEPEVVVTWRVAATIGGGTRVSFDASMGDLLWSGDEVLKAYSVDASGIYREGNFGLYDESTASELINSGSALFTGFDALPAGGYAWFSVGSNIHEYSDAHKYEFIFPSAQVQPRAGVIDGSMLKLVSDKVALTLPTLEEGVTEVEVGLEAMMRPVGTLLSFVPSTPRGTYAGEQVLSVALHAEQVISGPAAAMAYNFADYYDTPTGYLYWQSNDEGNYGPEGALIWDATSTTVTTTLTEPLSLEEQLSAVEGKAIYMHVAPLAAGKCTYVVTTDQAIYTFDPEQSLSFGEGDMLTILLDLESAKRLGNDDVRGELMYEGAIDAAYTIKSNATTSGLGYWYARTRDTGADWVTREGSQYPAFYENVQFEVIDDATGQPAEWLSVAYRANDTWWDYTVSENTASEPRSATVTATFADVNGYLVTDACRTKTTVITQQGYSSVKELGFYGGVGDQNIPGKGVTDQSLGYCVITVNGIFAESWGDNSNNEQALYANARFTVYTMPGGVGGGEVADWLTVGYGKDANGNFNSTHWLATATENTTGATRQALVYCEYTAPEGYTFANGATSTYKQCIITQPASSAKSVIAFWGGLGAEYTYGPQAYTAQGLSYWVITVDGTTATDWTGDSHNEQLLYGAAEFKCYDYTDGVRGAEVDWVRVDYKQENGRYIDTWWLADIDANETGAERRAEVVCTFPELEDYEYQDGQRERSTIIIQTAE